MHTHKRPIDSDPPDSELIQARSSTRYLPEDTGGRRRQEQQPPYSGLLCLRLTVTTAAPAHTPCAGSRSRPSRLSAFCIRHQLTCTRSSVIAPQHVCLRNLTHRDTQAAPSQRVNTQHIQRHIKRHTWVMRPSSLRRASSQCAPPSFLAGPDQCQATLLRLGGRLDWVLFSHPSFSPVRAVTTLRSVRTRRSACIRPRPSGPTNTHCASPQCAVRSALPQDDPCWLLTSSSDPPCTYRAWLRGEMSERVPCFLRSFG
ncbi:hypothetical protein C8Q80DRAFT_130507 [Daedaleopsis nitida]|nr:hypothetical protein C8Q80DRAFT_130507 [Daedaleopsis nitida]